MTDTLHRMPAEIKTVALSALHSPGSARRSVRQDALDRHVQRSGVEVPVMVCEGRGGYLILDGHRRVQAARRAGHSEIQVVVLEARSEDDAYEHSASWAALAGSLRPIDLTDLILARCAQRLGDEPATVIQGWKKVAKDPASEPDQHRTVRQAARDFGVEEVDAFLASAVKLLRLPEGLLSPLRQGALNEDQALALAGVKNLEHRTVWQTRAEAGEMTGMEIRRAAKQLREQEQADSAGSSDGAGADSEGEEDFSELKAALEQRIRSLPEARRAEARKYLRSLSGLIEGRA